MATQTSYASSVLTQTYYTNGANTYSEDGVYANWTSSSRNQNAYLYLGLAPFTIPTGSTINSVTIYVKHKYVNPAQINYSWIQAYNTNTSSLIGTQYVDSSWPTSDTTINFSAGDWTVASLNAGYLGIHFDPRRKNSNTSSSHLIDVVYATVDYTAPSIIPYYKVGGSWKIVSSIGIRVGGAWKTVSNGYRKINGTWTKIY